MKKTYYLDTCALLEGGDETIDILKNGVENKINIPITVIHELDGLMKDPSKRSIAREVVRDIIKHKDQINFIGDKEKLLNNDDVILQDVKHNANDNDDILVTNDLVLQLKAHINGVNVEPFKRSNPHLKENPYTGIIDVEKDDFINNCFYWQDGKLIFNKAEETKQLAYLNMVWGTTPLDWYQNCAMEILNDNSIPLTTIQSKAGTGKTYISLASALYQVFEKKKYSKIVIIKYPADVGKDIGFLPGSIYEKMEPYWKPIYKLLLKLQSKRRFDKGWINTDNILPQVNPRYIEFIPVNHLRGDNIDDAYVIISEGQNIDRNTMRTILSRMGDNVKVVVEGDINQIDNNICSKENNGLNWITKLMKGDKEYAHLTMNCKKTRGPICDLVNKYEL